MARNDSVLFPLALRDRLLDTVTARYPQKSFGYLVAGPESNHPVDFVLFDQNIRNDEEWRDEFESRGRYFVEHPDAGFVATPAESWRVQKYLFQRNLREVAVFHTHRRHPGNFSDIDYDLHISRFTLLWHLIVSLRNVEMPQLRPFDVSPAGVRELDLEFVS